MGLWDCEKNLDQGCSKHPWYKGGILAIKRQNDQFAPFLAIIYRSSVGVEATLMTSQKSPKHGLLQPERWDFPRFSPFNGLCSWFFSPNHCQSQPVRLISRRRSEPRLKRGLGHQVPEFTTPGAHDMGVINWGYMIRTYKKNGLEFRPPLSLGEYDKNNTKP